ncbi:uncharacterized protein LOC129218207 [Uloborus diversus]|uniref:uncharacterized protein LOC129218207 n=1 Tax=Uloborus diversus TaxID=327109 RepID=UPI00240A0B09|nr:uncharacterized protein LOC129218207 [Uloborus diversus]
MAKELEIREKSVRTIVKNKMGLRSYKINRLHFLNDTMKQKRLIKARRMFRLTAGARLSKVLFTDEKIFIIESTHNGQNHRQLLKQGQKKIAAAKIIGHSHFPASVMVWAAICATGKKPLVFIDRNVKINAASYQQRVLCDVLRPWATEHFGQDGFKLQQDWAPAHSARSTIAICEDLFPGFWGKDVWLPYSPELNPMDYPEWSILEEKISGKRYATVNMLKTALSRTWNEITFKFSWKYFSFFRKAPKGVKQNQWTTTESKGRAQPTRMVTFTLAKSAENMESRRQLSSDT